VARFVGRRDSTGTYDLLRLIQDRSGRGALGTLNDLRFCTLHKGNRFLLGSGDVERAILELDEILTPLDVLALLFGQLETKISQCIG
jgi:hypothetical protein